MSDLRNFLWRSQFEPLVVVRWVVYFVGAFISVYWFVLHVWFSVYHLLKSLVKIFSIVGQKYSLYSHWERGDHLWVSCLPPNTWREFRRYSGTVAYSLLSRSIFTEQYVATKQAYTVWVYWGIWRDSRVSVNRFPFPGSWNVKSWAVLCSHFSQSCMYTTTILNEVDVCLLCLFVCWVF